MREVAAALGYQVNPIARSLKTSRSETVGVLVPDLTNPLFPPIVRGIEDTLADSGYTVLTANTDNDPARTSSNFAAMQARQVDGFIVATALLDDPFMHEAAARGVPMVMVNRQTEHLDVSVVAGDDATGIERTVDHLVELGHRDIAHVAGPLQVSTGAVRLRAFRAAMQRHGLPDDRVVEAEAYSEAAGPDGAAAAARRRPAHRDRRGQRPARARLLRRAGGAPACPARTTSASSASTTCRSSPGCGRR